MYILIVQARVKAEFIDAFKQATAINAASSAKEPGIAGFDFLQQQDDPQKLVLYEVYRDPAGKYWCPPFASVTPHLCLSQTPHATESVPAGTVTALKARGHVGCESAADCFVPLLSPLRIYRW